MEHLKKALTVSVPPEAAPSSAGLVGSAGQDGHEHPAGIGAAPSSERERWKHLRPIPRAPACASVSLCSRDLPEPFVPCGGRGVGDPSAGLDAQPVPWVGGIGWELGGSLTTHPPTPPVPGGKAPHVWAAAKCLSVFVLAVSGPTAPLSPWSWLLGDTPPGTGVRATHPPRRAQSSRFPAQGPQDPLPRATPSLLKGRGPGGITRAGSTETAMT